MTERFTYDSKTVSILKDGEFWLDGNVDTACNHSEICNELNKLAEENEQLKSTMKEVTELLEEEVDLFSDKATEHDINAYVELRELDNKDAYYMATSTKKAIKMLKGDVE